MDKLIKGYRRFRRHVFPQKRHLYEKLADGQKPRYLFITCSDSRIVLHDITQADPGTMFIERSIGNVVPLVESGEHEALAAIEYAVVALGVKHVIICGHSHCGAIQALLNPESTASMPWVSAWLKTAECTRKAVEEKFGHLEGEELVTAAVEENVRIQVKHARKFPCVRDGLLKGTLRVHGWVLEFENGSILSLDPATDLFVPLEQAHSPLKRPPIPRGDTLGDAARGMM